MNNEKKKSGNRLKGPKKRKEWKTKINNEWMDEWKKRENECQGGKRKNEKTLCKKRKDDMS